MGQHNTASRNGGVLMCRKRVDDMGHLSKHSNENTIRGSEIWTPQGQTTDPREDEVVA